MRRRGCDGKQGGRPGAASRGAPRRLAPAQGADDRRRGEDPRPGVRRHLDLQDPLPRGPEAARAAPHRRWIPPLQPGRRRAAAGDPADAARRVPAAAGDPPGAGDRRLHRAAAERREPEAPRRLGRRAGDHLHARGPARARRASGEQFLRELAGLRDRRRPSAATGATSTTRPTSRSSAPRPSSPSSASADATCASSAPPPTARRRCSSSCSAPPLRSRSQARRKEAVENLESLAAVCGHLKHLLLVRDLRRLKPPRIAAPPSRREPVSSRVIAAEPDRVWDLVSDPHNLPRWWPRTTRVEDVRGADGARSPLDDGARDRAGSGVRADYRCTASTARRALRLGAADRGHPVRAVLRAAQLEIGLSRPRRGTEVTLTSERVAARDLAARLDDDARRGRARLDEALAGIERALVGWHRRAGRGGAGATPPKRTALPEARSRCCATSSATASRRPAVALDEVALPEPRAAARGDRRGRRRAGSVRRRPRAPGPPCGRQGLPGPDPARAPAARARARRRRAPGDAGEVARGARGLRARSGSPSSRSAAGRASSAASSRCAAPHETADRPRPRARCARSPSTSVSLTATPRPGLRGPEAEAALGARGLTLGHFPQSFEYATIGGFAATRSAGQASSRLRALRRARHRGRDGDARGRAAHAARPRTPPPGRRCASWSSAPRACSA